MNKREKITKIRESILNNQYPLEYDWNMYRYYNCYAYALGSTFKDEDIKSFDNIYNLGSISEIVYPPKTIKEADQAFKYDMKVLGISCRNSSFEEGLLPNEWKVVLYYESCFIDSYDFHFMRNNKDGSWSYKEGINGPIRGFTGEPGQKWRLLDIVGYYILKITEN